MRYGALILRSTFKFLLFLYEGRPRERAYPNQIKGEEARFSYAPVSSVPGAITVGILITERTITMGVRTTGLIVTIAIIITATKAHALV